METLSRAPSVPLTLPEAQSFMEPPGEALVAVTMPDPGPEPGPEGEPEGELEPEPEPEGELSSPGAGSNLSQPRGGSSCEESPEPAPEPPLLRLRPTSLQSQDISHLLTNLFKNLYTLDVIGEDIGMNLIKSRGGENIQHEKFVDELQKLRDEYAQKLADTDVVERHIIQARARATAEEERILNNIKAQGFGIVHLPPVKSTFRWCVDNNLLKKNNLICPSDYIRDPVPISRAPKGEDISECYKLTFSCKQHSIATEEVQKVTEIVSKKLPAIPSEVSLSTLTKCSTPEVKPPKVVKKCRCPKNKMWMNHLNTAQRVQERQLLNRFENQHQFLKNPRFYPPNTANGGKSLIFPLKKTGPMGDERNVEFSERFVWDGCVQRT